MQKVVALSILALAAGALGACHSCPDTDARFWEVRDGAGRGAYTVDTRAVGHETIPAKYVSASGQYVALGDTVEQRPMSEAEWRAATNGASYSLKYCSIRKACWASVSDR